MFGFEVLEAVTFKYIIIRDVTPLSLGKVNRRLGGTYHSHILPGYTALYPRISSFLKKGGNKAIPLTVREGPYGCETSRFPHFLDIRLTDGGEVVSLTRRPPFTPKEILGTHFC
jgi:hypothetical protein